MKGNETSPKPVGKTASAGFQIGVRRTIDVTQQQAWEYLLSPEGLKLWIGDVEAIELNPGDKYESANGACGEMRVVKHYEQLRLTWQLARWERPSTLQIRFLPAARGGTTLSFHQEHLDGPNTREEMKRRWEEVIARVAECAADRQL
ncbi:SRPBCC family protein [Paenibacillus ginsengarvi]|uniref:SRPBCC domain-containing protein n=1 Tax=Paenibacillus ginsengarvi TaxID=400777 RepID=A0A3B0BDK4_9BACL|nr:SRPBCC domain-containing protein [Paenibacillus ginsengarvi]RKN71235.1 SRPBCC domain-containing protein [Paenibacillus ginsengarvi]